MLCQRQREALVTAIFQQLLVPVFVVRFIGEECCTQGECESCNHR